MTTIKWFSARQPCPGVISIRCRNITECSILAEGSQQHMQLLIDKNKFNWYMNPYHEPCFIVQQFMQNGMGPTWHNKAMAVRKTVPSTAT